MESYSQHGQDLYVYETFFKNFAAKGCFVEIGAYDGVTLSNTLLFERHLGWPGLCIEPLPSAFEKLRMNRSAVCVNCAVSDTDGVADFVDVDVPKYGKMYSGLRDEYDPRQIEFMESYASDAKLLKVPTRRLADILDEHGIGSIDYMSIDTEGNELKILRSIDLEARDIRVLSVENNFQDRAIPDYLAGFGYRLIKVFAGFDDLYAK
jgi:FkbM family methyltransferase